MTNETSDCTSIAIVKHRERDRREPSRNLRLEILELRSMLKEHEAAATRHLVMLREGDHRIKNSLQLIASMMRLQARHEPSHPTKVALRGAAERVNSVAGIHDALQAAGGAGVIDLGATLRAMCASLQALAGNEPEVGILVDANPMEVPVTIAQPLVLAVNELVVNSLRHAFVGRSKGSVHVALLCSDTRLQVIVSDDGVGLRENERHGYGMSLVAMMVKQLHGELRVERGPGAHFILSVPFQRTQS